MYNRDLNFLINKLVKFQQVRKLKMLKNAQENE